MKRALLPVALAAATFAHGQKGYKPIGLQVHIGYGVSGSFNADGESRTMSGPEIGVAFPIGNFGSTGILLEPSYFAGARFGSLDRGDADVYRLTLFAHRTFGQNIGVRLGVGYAVSGRARRGDYDGNSDVVFDLGVEIPFQFRLLRTVAPYVDVHGVVAASEEQLSGFFVGLGLRV